jgi:hypothetical protein
MKHVWRLLRLLGCGWVAYVFLAYVATAFGRGKITPAQETGAFIMFLVLMTALLFLALEAYLSLRRRVVELDARIEALEEELAKKLSSVNEVT